MQKQLIKSGAATVMTLALAACGGGGSGSGGGLVETPVDNVNGIPASVLKNNAASIESAVANIDGTASTDIALVNVVDFNTISVISDAQQRTFIYDSTSDRFVNPEDPGEVLELSGTGKEARFGHFTDGTGGFVSEERYFLVGNRTMTSEMPTSLGVTYQGTFVGFETVEGQLGYNDVEGQVTLEADFANNTIEGEFAVGNFDFQLPETQISLNGFVAFDKLTSEQGIGINQSVVNGGFYGDSAEEVGGSVFIDYTTIQGGQIVGVFHGQ